MGYTHYWRHNHTIDDDTWTAITVDAQAIIDAVNANLATAVPPPFPIALGDGFGEGGDPTISNKAITFNGVGDDAHETFAFGRSGGGFDFCKTRRKPYDAAVTAILCIVDCHTMGRVQVSSDGDADEWAVGLALAQSVQPGATLPNRIDEGVCDE